MDRGEQGEGAAPPGGAPAAGARRPRRERSLPDLHLPDPVLASRRGRAAGRGERAAGAAGARARACVCARVRVCARARVRPRVCARACVSVRVCMCACVRARAGAADGAPGPAGETRRGWGGRRLWAAARGPRALLSPVQTEELPTAGPLAAQDGTGPTPRVPRIETPALVQLACLGFWGRLGPGAMVLDVSV